MVNAKNILTMLAITKENVLASMYFRRLDQDRRYLYFKVPASRRHGATKAVRYSGSSISTRIASKLVSVASTAG